MFDWLALVWLLTLFGHQHFATHAFSNLDGPAHCKAEDRLLEKRDEAHLNNRFFTRMTCIMRWANELNLNLAVAIENLHGSLPAMLLMKESEKWLGLKKVMPPAADLTMSRTTSPVIDDSDDDEAMPMR